MKKEMKTNASSPSRDMRRAIGDASFDACIFGERVTLSAPNGNTGVLFLSSLDVY